ncbi:MAG: hypothetical protein FH751_03440 [Firmicutes bacterium]|nr:hypothetical protein [Bacillota bacterium]
MLIDNNTFKDIDSFIKHMMKKDEVVGIVEYGGRAYNDMSVGGDYDLTVIFDKPISKNITGVHFHISGIPIDCMLLSINDFLSDVPDNEFLLAHLNCTILFDRDDTIKGILDDIKIKWRIPKGLSDYEKNTFRFTYKHVLDKLEYRLHDNELYSKYFIYSSFDWFLQCYARIKNLEIGKPKEHLNYIRNNDTYLFDIINRMYEADNLDEQFEMLKKCANHMAASIGGLWLGDEILFHIKPDGEVLECEQKKIISQLFE